MENPTKGSTTSSPRSATEPWSAGHTIPGLALSIAPSAGLSAALREEGDVTTYLGHTFIKLGPGDASIEEGLAWLQEDWERETDHFLRASLGISDQESQRLVAALESGFGTYDRYVSALMVEGRRVFGDSIAMGLDERLAARSEAAQAHYDASLRAILGARRFEELREFRQRYGDYAVQQIGWRPWFIR